MTSSIFKIQGSEFKIDVSDQLLQGFTVDSQPRPYNVEFINAKQSNLSWITEEFSAQNHPLLLVDEKIMIEQLGFLELRRNSFLSIRAEESNKDISKVLEICDFLQSHNANRGSMIFVIGGGILQDLGAFASSLLKRGVPWTFIPTTLLAQGDSCVGGKTAVNHRGTKNLLGLFSAPRRVVIDTGFLRTLQSDDLLSGCGEILRLCVTGGSSSLELFESELNGFFKHSEVSIRRMIACALAIKQQVVEADEFELDLRRSMNYGHSVGHAIEALSNHSIPHGIGVSLGMLVENQIAVQRGLLDPAHAQRIERLCHKLIPENIWNVFRALDFGSLLPLLASDKKAEGSLLKLATIQSIGDMIFVDLPLNEEGLLEVKLAIGHVLERSTL